MDSRAHGPQNEQVAARLRIVEEHVRRENEHDLAGIMATFADEAKYDDAPWSEQRLGRDAVEQYYRDLLVALPDLHIDVRDRLVTEDAVVLEVLISGTQVGGMNLFSARRSLSAVRYAATTFDAVAF